MGFQSSRTWDIHGHGYRIRQTPYASHRAISTLRVQGQELHGENMTGKRRGGIFPLFPSLVFSYQDTTLPLKRHLHLASIHVCSFPMFTSVTFLSFIPHSQFQPPPQPLALSIYTVLFTTFQLIAFIIFFKQISEESESSTGHSVLLSSAAEKGHSDPPHPPQEAEHRST